MIFIRFPRTRLIISLETYFLELGRTEEWSGIYDHFTQKIIRDLVEEELIQCN